MKKSGNDIFYQRGNSTMDEKIDTINKIEGMIHTFCQKHLNEEIEGYCMKLCGTLARKRKIDINRGKVEIWAAGIVYVIARLNFLFDKENKPYIPVDTIGNFFNTKKSTTGNKASLIMDVCNLGIGAVGYSSKAISDMFTFYQTPEGFIIPKSMLESPEFLIDFAEGEEAEELQRQIEERKNLRLQKQQEKKAQQLQKEQERKARMAEIRKKKAEEEEKSRDAHQLSMFD